MMLDFRRVADPTLLKWALPRAPRGTAKSRTVPASMPDASKLRFQTPVLPVRMFDNGPSSTVLMTLRPDENDTHQEFADFLWDLERVAAAYLPEWLVDGQPAPSIWSCIRARGISDLSLRLSAFDDVLWFGVAGDFLREPPKDVRAAAAVLEFGGAWVTDSSWGIKLRIVQLRDATGRPPPPKKRKRAILIESSSDDDLDSSVTESYAFLDEGALI